MTNEQRAQIQTMRQNGQGYAAIADATGLSKGSVKAFCRAHGLSGVRAGSAAVNSADAKLCPACGKTLKQVPGHKKRRFCSDECRVTWWNAHPEQVNRKAVYTFTCAGCGKAFTAYGNSHRKYCSHDCYIAHRFQGGDGDE